MQKLMFTTIAVSFLLIAAGCSTNSTSGGNQMAQQQASPEPTASQTSQMQDYNPPTAVRVPSMSTGIYGIGGLGPSR
jgi:Tfp pilus assembly protein PilP